MCLRLAAILLSTLWPSSAARAEDVSKLKIADFVKSAAFSGDFRGRYEAIYRRDPGITDRTRFRYRLRLGTELRLPDELMAAFRFGAGTGEQFSNNQTFDNLGSQKNIFVDLAYLSWSPRVYEPLSIRLVSGKIPNLLWRTYSSDLIFDDDFNPEGFFEGVGYRAGGWGVFVNGLQMVADEDPDTARNQWLFSQQAGLEAPMPGSASLKSAVGYHKWSDENRSGFSQVGVNLGNRRTAAGVLRNRFGVLEWTSELAGKIILPFSAQFTLARNARAQDLGGPQARDGYQFGLILGKAKGQGGWEIGLFKKYSESDVTVADVADSDFGEGGTNRVGGIFWLTYNLRDWLQARAKFFTTRMLDSSLQTPALPVSTRRLQLDLQTRF
ncbi:MAG: putative porin [Elusimicrobia bacterium]|nr:putative porin [Elusimicrobiota bacterium]